MPTSSTIVLPSGNVTTVDVLAIEVVRPAGLPAAVLIEWPAQASVCDPRKFAESAAAAMKVMAASVTRLNQLRAQHLLAVRRDIEGSGRPAVLIYAGDRDPTRKDIDRDFMQRVGAFDEVIRVALTAEQGSPED